MSQGGGVHGAFNVKDLLSCPHAFVCVQNVLIFVRYGLVWQVHSDSTVSKVAARNIV